ncbi:MAG: YkgJ family cysteine cluster protein [bacterium]
MKKQLKRTKKHDKKDWKQSICAKCKGLCCKYITVDIEEPKDDEDLDNIRWYLIHDGISILVEDERWMVKVDARCKHLQADYQCAVYNRRPEACKQYDTENCDYRTVSENLPKAYREFEEYGRLRRYVKGRWAKAHRGRKKKR